MADDLEVVVGRPHSMGRPDVGFGAFTRRRHGVDCMGASAERLRRLVDETRASRLLFLGVPRA